jgi:hypothetical protein
VAAGVAVLASELLLAASVFTFRGQRQRMLKVAEREAAVPYVTLRDRALNLCVIAVLYVPVRAVLGEPVDGVH